MKPVSSDLGRYAIIPEWLVDVASGNALKVFAALAAKYADRESDMAFPARTKLMKDTGLSDNTIDRCLRQLEQVKALTVERNRKKDDKGPDTNLYTLHFGRPQNLTDVAPKLPIPLAPKVTPGGSPKITPLSIIILDPESIDPDVSSSTSAKELSNKEWRKAFWTSWESVTRQMPMPSLGYQLDDLLDEYPDMPAEWGPEAINRAAAANRREFRYVLGILRNWGAAGQMDDPKEKKRDRVQEYDGDYRGWFLPPDFKGRADYEIFRVHHPDHPVVIEYERTHPHSGGG